MLANDLVDDAASDDDNVSADESVDSEDSSDRMFIDDHVHGASNTMHQRVDRILAAADDREFDEEVKQFNDYLATAMAREKSNAAHGDDIVPPRKRQFMDLKKYFERPPKPVRKAPVVVSVKKRKQPDPVAPALVAIHKKKRIKFMGSSPTRRSTCKQCRRREKIVVGTTCFYCTFAADSSAADDRTNSS